MVRKVYSTREARAAASPERMNLNLGEQCTSVNHCQMDWKLKKNGNSRLIVRIMAARAVERSGFLDRGIPSQCRDGLTLTLRSLITQ